MQVNKVNSSSSFGGNTIKFDELLPENVLKSEEKIIQRLFNEGGGDNFIRIVPDTIIRFSNAPTFYKGEFSGMQVPKTDFTGKIAIFVSKQAKTFGEKIKNFFGLNDFKMVISEESNIDSIVKLATNALKELNLKK